MTFEWTDRQCPLCGSHNETRIFAQSNIELELLTEYAFASRKLPEYMHLRLVECPGCRLLYASPALSEQTISNLYRQAAFDSASESHLASLIYKRIVEKHLSKLPDRTGAIDIGAGDGAFCERLLEMGFSDVIGVEPSTAPITAAKPDIRPLLQHGNFRADDFAPDSVALVSCFQVLEHVSTPLELASTAFRILKPNGLFLAVVHNQRALSARVLGMKSPIYDIEHLQLFNKESGRKLLEHAGFEHIRVYPLWNKYPLQYWMRLFPFSHSIKGQLISYAKSSGIGNVLISLPAGNLVLTGVKGPGSR